MPQFRYRAVTHTGEIVVGEVDASRREKAVRRIVYLGQSTIDAEIAARRWIEILAAPYLAWCESRQELRSLMVRRENGHAVVRHAEPARDAMLRDGQAYAPASRRAMRDARWLAAIFALLLASAPSAVAQPRDPPATVPSNPVAAQSLEQLSTIIDRPLFSPSRRPPAPPPAPAPIVQAAEPPAPPPPPPNLILFGVVMDGESARAVVRAGADGKLVRAQIGDEIDGWKVSQIEGRKVVLSLDGRFATFTLFSGDRGRAESAGGTVPAGEPKSLQRQSQAQQTSLQAAAPQTGQPKRRRRSRE